MNLFSNKTQMTSNPMSTTTNQNPIFGVSQTTSSGLGGSTSGLGGN
jgi:hypothetical protein